MVIPEGVTTGIQEEIIMGATGGTITVIIKPVAATIDNIKRI
jgi:hypothetical protein